MDDITLQKMDFNASIVLLEKQIEAARVLLDNRPLNTKLYAEWNEETRQSFVKIYGMDSPNVRSIETTVGATPIWMGMPPEVAETYQASRLMRTIDMLKSCIVSLRWKAKNPQEN